MDEDFIRQNFKDADEAEKLIAKNRKKAIFVVGVGASFVVVLLIALGYAIMKIDNTKKELELAKSTQAQVDQCMMSVRQQAADAASAQAIAEEVNRNTMVRLEECARRPNKK